MTDMYDDPPVFEGKLEPFPHAERPSVGGGAVAPLMDR